MVGLTGPNAAGKGEVAGFLAARGYSCHSLSDVVREAAAARGLPASRDVLVRLGNEMRRDGGPGALVERLAPRIRPPAVIDSIRNPGEVAALRRLPGFFLLGVQAPAEVRFQRIRERNRAGDTLALDEFRRNERREDSGDTAEQRIGATVALADAVVINDGSLDELRRRVEAALTGAARRTR